MLIVLKGHLIIEAALVDICTRLLKNPKALERETMRFSTRLNLVCALLNPHCIPESAVCALRDLNRLRNSLAHNLEPDDLDKNLKIFFKRFTEFKDFRTLYQSEQNISRRLTGCISFLCGVLGDIGKSDDPAFDSASAL